jgi:uncharacterized protein YcaQ
MPRTTVSRRAVRLLFLQRQHLLRPRSEPLTGARLQRFAEDVGGVQMDSINVLDRAHYLTLWNRFGPYDRARLDRLVYGRRVLFEYWAHAACLVPMSSLPWWRRAMADYRLRNTGWSNWLRRNTKIVGRVKESISATGPMGNADFEGRRPPGGGGWWNWKPVHHALHYLWMTGALAIHSRKHFHKRYDLMERALPAAAACETVSPETFARWHVERSLHAMGVATDSDLVGYLTFPRFFSGARREALRALLEDGTVREITVEDSPMRWLVLARDLSALRRAERLTATGTALLAPFDSLLWHRDRVARLFGFDYRIEVYTPGPKRVHGYYTLPILHDGHLIGRVDAKTHREDRRLEVRHVHFESWFASGALSPVTGDKVDQPSALAGVADALRSLALFVEGDELTLSRVSPQRLRPPLRRAMSSRPS